MKLRELKTNLAIAKRFYTIKFSNVSINQKIITRITGIKNFRKAIDLIEQTGLLKNLTSKIHESVLFTTTRDNIEINQDESDSIKILVDKIKNMVDEILFALDSTVGMEEKEFTISIKLNNINDFEDLSKTSSAFHDILSQTILNDKIKGQIKITNIENGSLWLDIFVGTELAISLIASLTWSAAVIYKKIQEGRLVSEGVRALKIKNDSLTEIQQAQKKELDLLIDAESKFIKREHFSNEDKEILGRIKNSVKPLSEQLQKGTEVYPLLNSPEEIKNLFPDFKQLESITSKIKQLKK